MLFFLGIRVSRDEMANFEGDDVKLVSIPVKGVPKRDEPRQ